MDKRILYRATILDNGQNPSHRKATPPTNYIEANAKIYSCEDHFKIFFKLHNNKIKDIIFTGFGCVISTAALNLVCGYIINLTIKESLNFIKNYQNMITSKKYDQEKLKDLISLENINQHLNRIQCALIGPNTIYLKLKELHNG